jgi:hypothetical protein
VLHHRETLTSGLLNNWKKREMCVCVLNVRKGVNLTHVFVEKNLPVQQGKQIQEPQVELRRFYHNRQEIQPCSDWKICRDGLPLFSYEIHLKQSLSEVGIDGRYSFARKLE